MQPNFMNAQLLTPSPCIQQCCLDEQDICCGCGRSLEEIKQWTLVDETVRRQFLANAQQRKQNNCR